MNSFSKKSRAAERGGRWDCMQRDMAASIFQHLNIMELLLLVPLVCRSWRAASLDPLCWSTLDMRLFADVKDYWDLPHPHDKGRPLMRVFKAAMDRCGAAVRCIIFSIFVAPTDEELEYISQSCPTMSSDYPQATIASLKPSPLPAAYADIYSNSYLSFMRDGSKLLPQSHNSQPQAAPNCDLLSADGFCGALSNWSELEDLAMHPKDIYPCGWPPNKSLPPFYFSKIMEGIGMHCQRLIKLRLLSCINLSNASEITKHIPWLKILDLSSAPISEAGFAEKENINDGT